MYTYISQLYRSHEDLETERALEASGIRAMNGHIHRMVDTCPLALWIYGRPGGEWSRGGPAAILGTEDSIP